MPKVTVIVFIAFPVEPSAFLRDLVGSDGDDLDGPVGGPLDPQIAAGGDHSGNGQAAFVFKRFKCGNSVVTHGDSSSCKEASASMWIWFSGSGPDVQKRLSESASRPFAARVWDRFGGVRATGERRMAWNAEKWAKRGKSG